MKSRMALGLLQGVGGLTVVAYPFLLFSSLIAFVAADTWRGQALRAFLYGYPVLWAALWGASWRVLALRRAVLAFVLSAPPALAAVAAGTLYALLSVESAAYLRTIARQDMEKASTENPLVAELIALQYGQTTWPDVKRAIEAADPALLSKPTAGGGSPLRYAVRSSDLIRRLDFAGPQPAFLAAARLLVARGAGLAPAEEAEDAAEVWAVDVLRRGLALPDAAAERENPIVWRIVSAGSESDLVRSPTVGEMARARPDLLQRETTTYGTPLHAALLRNFTLPVGELLREGAALSARERAVPSYARQEERVTTSSRER